MKVLVSFLGRGRARKDSPGYEDAVYRFSDGTVSRTPYFGLTLAQHTHPDRFVVLGTAGSIWDVFALDGAGTDEALMSALADLELDAAVKEHRVTSTMLTSLEPHVSRTIGMPVTLGLIPSATTHAEQVAVLASLSKWVSDGDEVTLDITHSYRHLPMLALVAARYLAAVRQARVTEIFYGALEMRGEDKVAPVIGLSGLMTMLDWVDALARYDATGDYGVLGALLAADGLASACADMLNLAAFQERATNSPGARASLTTAMSALSGHEGTFAPLFRDELERRVAWRREKTRHAREFALFERYLERADFLRAAIYLQEAAVSAKLYCDSVPDDDRDSRQAALDALRDESSPCRAQMQLLSGIRNSMAHGERARHSSVTHAMQDEAHLRGSLQDIARIVRGVFE